MTSDSPGLSNDLASILAGEWAAGEPFRDTQAQPVCRGKWVYPACLAMELWAGVKPPFLTCKLPTLFCSTQFQ